MERVRNFLASDFYYSFKKAPIAVASFIVAMILVFSALFAPLISPYNPFDPATLNLMNGFSAPMEPNAFTGDLFWLGTDDQGRDVFSTILYGMRVSLFVGFSAVLFALILGVSLGLLSAYAGGRTDAIIMRIADVQLTFPAILIAMLIFGIAKGFTPVHLRDQMAIWVLIVSIGLSDWVQFARVVRGAAMVEKQKRICRGGNFNRAWPRGHCSASYIAKCAVISACDRDDFTGIGDYHRSNLVVSGRGGTAHPAEPWHAYSNWAGVSFLGRMVDFVFSSHDIVAFGAVDQSIGRLVA